MQPAAPPPAGTRPTAPPTCRSSANSTGEPGWIAAANASSATASIVPSTAPSPR